MFTQTPEVRVIQVEAGQNPIEALLAALGMTEESQEPAEAGPTPCDCLACTGDVQIRQVTPQQMLDLLSGKLHPEDILTADTPIKEPAREENLEGARMVSEKALGMREVSDEAKAMPTAEDAAEAQSVVVTQNEDGSANLEVQGLVAERIRQALLDELYVLACAQQNRGLSASVFLETLGAMMPERRLEQSKRAEKAKRRADLIDRILKTDGHRGAIAGIVDDLMAAAN